MSEGCSTPSYRPSTEQIDAVQHYLAREFPGAVRGTWWEATEMAQIFEMTHGEGLQHLVMTGGFWQSCPDCVAALRDSEFVDYIRETRAPRRRFCVTWQDGTCHIRSKPL